MGIDAGLQAAGVRAAERGRARRHLEAIEEIAAALAPALNGEVAADRSVQLDEQDAAVQNEVTAASDLLAQLRAVDQKLAALGPELEVARKARNKMIMIGIAVGVVVLILLYLFH